MLTSTDRIDSNLPSVTQSCDNTSMTRPVGGYLSVSQVLFSLEKIRELLAEVQARIDVLKGSEMAKEEEPLAPEGSLLEALKGVIEEAGGRELGKRDDAKN